ncbi:hypothetical protein BSL78_22041 [Apostichopus japonicus]|uniref:Uncharacterized protein n=1 Tax=Stichopus japonicus TaxID=307972 RepID=A0A2G8JZD9_STIJA|nr:hypothetical protein BSL78_22041 [Apostichopus japonicus]
MAAIPHIPRTTLVVKGARTRERETTLIIHTEAVAGDRQFTTAVTKIGVIVGQTIQGRGPEGDKTDPR